MTFAYRKNDIPGIIDAAEKCLALAGIDNPKLDARILAAHALKLDRAQLLGRLDQALNEREKRRIEVLVACRARRQPIARILGTREFHSLPFGLNEATLVPRPESETVVEAALKWVQSSGVRDQENEPRTPNPESRILDLGTGSGCLLLSLLHEFPQATGLGVDCTPRAVDQAKMNAERLGIKARAEFRVNNWADGIDERFDIVISNPPYVVRKDIAELMPEVRDYDPHMALDGGEDGLEVYRLLIPQLPHLLKPNGAAVFEIGIGQAAAVPNLFRQARFANIQTLKDLSGIERCVTAAA